MKVLFRVDSSLNIGQGHLMRCVTLAKKLREHSVDVCFICRNFPGNAINILQRDNFVVYILPFKFSEDLDDNHLKHSNCLTVSQEEDANECKEILKQEQPDWVIVDSYDIDETWEGYLKSFYKKLMVIDDLADRRHVCNILLDQTYGREVHEYKGLVPSNCKHLLGSRFSLLKDDFRTLRGMSLERRKEHEIEKILVCLGGTDPNNYTTQILTRLSEINLSKSLRLNVVVNSKSPYLYEIQKLAISMPYETKVLVDVGNMAELMVESDLAIGASGSMSWERCCLGLPTIQLVIAENQNMIASKLEEISAAIYLRSIKDLEEKMILVEEYMNRLSLSCSSIVDGKGLSRVINVFLGRQQIESFYLTPAQLNDSLYIYGLQTEKSRRYAINPEVPTWDDHSTWYGKLMSSPNSQLFITKFSNTRVGMIRVDNIKDQICEISIIIDQAHSGKGYGSHAISLIKFLLPSKKLKAVVHRENIASCKVFFGQGFKLTTVRQRFLELMHG